METLVIPSSKRKAMALAGAGIALLAMAAVLLLVIPEQETGLRARIAAWITIPFGVLIAVYGLALIISGRPSLVVNEQGIVDNASAAAVGFVPWAEITGIKLYDFHGQRFLAIHLADADKYLDRASVLRKLLIRGNRSVSGSIVNIPQIALSVPLERVMERMHTHIVAARYGKAD